MVKGISWRIIGTIDTIIISFIITRRIDLSFSIGGIEVITKVIIYYVHERIWSKIKWGRY